MTIHTITTLALFTILGLAVVSDLRTRRIPNVLTISGLFLALGLRALTGTGPLVDGLAGAGIAFALAVPLVLMGGLGGGDAKLLAAVGGFLGPGDLVTALLVTALSGGVMALAAAIRKGALMETLFHARSLVAGLVTAAPAEDGARRTIHTPGALAIPYGLAIGVGALAGWFV